MKATGQEKGNRRKKRQIESIGIALYKTIRQCSGVGSVQCVSSKRPVNATVSNGLMAITSVPSVLGVRFVKCEMFPNSKKAYRSIAGRDSRGVSNRVPPSVLSVG